MVSGNSPMAAGFKIVSILVVPVALALMPLLATLAQQANTGGSQLLERVYQAQDYFALSELAREQITLNPKSPYGHYYLALALQQTGQMREASAEYRKVIELDKNGPYGMRALKILQGQSKPASAAATTAIAKPTQANPAVPSPQTATTSSAASGTGANLNGLAKQRECLINAAEREKASATARFNGEVNHINQQEGIAAADKDARIQDALKRLMRIQSDVDAKLSRQLSDLGSSGMANSGNQGTINKTGSIVTSGAGGLVHSYEHLDNDAESVVLPSENPLSATAIKMQVNTNKKGRAKSK